MSQTLNERAIRRAAREYQTRRQPWRNTEQVKEVSDSKVIADLRRWSGAPGRQAGRIIHRTRLPAHEETTAQLGGLYPFLAGHPVGAAGAYIGRDRFSRSPHLFDPFEFYDAGILSNPNMLVAGVIGSGKSSLLKTLCLRLWAFGHHFVCPADTKGEMAALANAVGADVVRLGPGGHALNPLWAPKRPGWMDEERYVKQIEAHRLLLLSTLGETASGRPLTAIETTALELALSSVTQQATATSADRLATPTLPTLVEALLQPSEELAALVPIDHQVLLEGSRDLGLRFRSMVRGALAGVFDGDSVEFDLDKPGIVIDISRIRASDAAVALTMTCGQALTDLILTFSRDRWLKILDECWRQIRYPAIVRRISEGQKLARGDDNTTGSATLIALHRISDLLGAGPEVRDLAMGLLADTSTRVIYNQASDQLSATQEALGLSDAETAYLPRFGQGTALWRIGGRPSVVDHIVLNPGMEWNLISTDSRMRKDDDDAYESGPGPSEMRAEIGQVA